MPVGTHISFNGHIEIEPIQHLFTIGTYIKFVEQVSEVFTVRVRTVGV